LELRIEEECGKTMMKSKKVDEQLEKSLTEQIRK
jgi:hypothetical protein